MATLRQLAARLRKEADRIPEEINETTKDTAVALVAALANETPVDTSEATSNWQLAVGNRPSTAIPAYSPGNFGNTRAASIAATIRAAESAVQSRKPGSPIYVSNLADHIVPLNEGTSAQAPAGFVDAAVIRVRESINDG